MPKKQTKRAKRNKWFIKVRGSYLPASAEGWLSYIPFVTFLVLSPLVAALAVNSEGLLILVVALLWLVAAAAMTNFASKHA